MKPIIHQISDEYPKDLKNVCAIVISMYKTFLKKIEKSVSLSLTKAITIPMGLSTQIANFRYVEAERTLENLIKYQKRTNKEGPTRMNKMNILNETETMYSFQIKNECCFNKVFSEFGMPELTTIFCDIDNAIFNVYCPDKIVFHRNGQGNRIADGAEVCKFYCKVIN